MLRQVFALLLSFALLQGNLGAAWQACASQQSAHGSMADMAAHAAGDAPAASSVATLGADESPCCDAPLGCDESGDMALCGAMVSCASATMPVRALATAALVPEPTEEVVGPVLSPLARALVPELPPPRA